MSRLNRCWFFAGLAVLLLWMAGPAAAQLQTGDLYGTVIGEDGAPLPGVTVTVEGVGSPKVLVTDERGEFRALGLYPGTYKVTAELQGHSTLEYPDIGIRVGGKTTIEITLSSAVEDVITVTGEAPLLDERKLNTGANIPAEALDKVPTARDPWSLLSQAPGVLVDRFNLGGNESGQQSAFLGSGSTSRDNVFSIDGVVLTDMNAVGASATYFDFGAFEEVQFTTSSTDVTVATSGVTVNQVTKRGTNTWRGQARYLRTDGEWQSDPVVFSDGLVGNQIDAVEEYGADVGGPLWKDHLWIWGSYGKSDINNIARGGQLDRTELEDLNSKLNFAIGEQNAGVFHYWTNDKLKFGRGAGPARAPETTRDQTTPQDIYKIEDTWIPTSSFYLTALWARDDGIFTLTPQGGLDADIYTDAEGVLRGTYADFTQEAVIDQARLDMSYFFNTGAASHELKFGGGFREQENFSGTVWPRGKFVNAGELTGLDPGIAVVAFARDRQVGLRTNYDSAWVQDTLTIDRLTINAGLRYDKQRGENLATSDPGNAQANGLLPPLDFKGNDAGGFEWETVVPRVGATYALGEDRKTLLRGSFSQYAEQLGQIPLITRVNPINYVYAYFYFEDANGNLVLDPSERNSLQFAYPYNFDPDHPDALITPNVNDPNLDPAMTNELTLGLEHSFNSNLAGGVNLVYRNVTDVPETRYLIVDETGQTRVINRGDFEQIRTIQEKLPNGQLSDPIPIYDLKDGLEFTGGELYTNGDREINYLGTTLSLNKRLANRWSARGSFTWADWDWDIGPEFRAHDDPTDEIADDLGFADGNEIFTEQSGGNKIDVLVGAQWSFHLDGLYQIAPERPWGFNVGASLDGHQGYISPPYARVGSAFGRRNVQLTRDIEEFRNPDVMVLNAHVDKDFAFSDVRLTLSLDGFNLTNEDDVLQVERNSRVGRAYLVNETLSPRVFRVGATVRYR
ncbi:MAG TPA: TonB-dependent receptor [Thermoanaerobaculia bacterium]|nr:TonB-dependent receptor [Thermoanaerobaculia bacterium]